MQDARVFSADEAEASKVSEWLAARLTAAGQPKAKAQRIAAKLRADWARMVHLLYPRKCQDQLVMISVSGEGEGVEVALVTETCGRFNPNIAKEVSECGLGRLVRGELEGLARLTLSMDDKAPA